ncbi:MAG: tetratricopeptide repeat protein [Planctomycetota bacterium]
MRTPWAILLLLTACDSAPQPIDPSLLRPVPPAAEEAGENAGELQGPPAAAAGEAVDQRSTSGPEHEPPPDPVAPAKSSRFDEGIALLQQGNFRAADPILREELAEGTKFREAALALASLYKGRESHVQAEAIILAGLSRDPEDPSMGLLYARILSDINRWDESAVILRRLVDQNPDRVDLILALVAAERALNRLDEAAAVLESLLQDHAENSLVEARRSELETLKEDLAEERRQGRRLSQTASELLAVLRAGDSRAERIRAFQALIARPSTHPRAVLAAFSQEDPIMRIQAVRAWPAEDSDMRDLPENLRVLFDDPDARVRAESSALARRLPPQQAAGLILAAMEKETDGYAFRVMHADMSQILQQRLILPPGAEDNPEARKMMVQRWREVWRR